MTHWRIPEKLGAEGESVNARISQAKRTVSNYYRRSVVLILL
jgi:hypothetical protein